VHRRRAEEERDAFEVGERHDGRSYSADANGDDAARKKCAVCHVLVGMRKVIILISIVVLLAASASEYRGRYQLRLSQATAILKQP
jgi:hypothetical protein